MHKFRYLSWNDKVFYIVNALVLTIFFIMVLYPCVFVVSASLSEGMYVNNGKVVLFPVGFTWENYSMALSMEVIWIGFFNSVKYAAIGAFISVSMTMTVAYALSRDNVPGNKVVMFLYLVTMFFSGGLIPTYLVIRSLDMVNETAQEIHKNGGRKMMIVSSGHTADTIEQQAEEFCQVAESGTDALIWITNRLDINNEGDDVWIANAEKLLKLLPENVKLGLYECPYPYKRLLTPKILKWCVQTGRFHFVKDTCCDAQMIKERLELIEGSTIRLLNANCQTLLQSLKDGGHGYCGIMSNFHPKLYNWLCENFEKEPEKAEVLQAFLGTTGFTESGLPYPLTAKYHMNLVGIPTANVARTRNGAELTEYAKASVRQIKIVSDYFENSFI